MQYFSLYLKFIQLRFRSMTENRLDYLIRVVSLAVMYAGEFAILWVLVRQFRVIGSWNSYEVMLLYALNLLSYSIAASFLFHPCKKLPGRIQSGEFDEMLTKPLTPFFYLISREVGFGYVGHAVVSVSVMALCFVRLDIVLSPLKLLFLAVTIISGVLIQGAAFVLTSVPSFWMVQNRGLSDIFMNDLKSFIRYPISIYNSLIQVFLTLVVPYAFINFYPAQYFLNKQDFTLFHPSFQFLSPLFGIWMAWAAYKAWNTAIDHYKSTGS